MDERTALLQRVDPAANTKKLAKFRNVVYFSTFIAYAMSHFSRKCYTNVKVELRSIGVDPILLSQMDTAFMFTYAVGSFFSGKLGDTYHAPTIVALGLIGSSLCVFALAAGVWGDIVDYSYGTYYAFFMGVWLVHGMFQSTGGPVGTAIMGNWFGSKNRGWIFGTWTCHQYVGNITAAVVATAILHSGLDWTWALSLPATVTFLWGIWMWTNVPEKPSDVGVVTDDASQSSAATADSLEAISFGAAIRIPNVIGYALAFGFFKLINYAMFFWLPYFLSAHFSPGASNMISVLYDVGMMPGGIIVGTVSDLYGGRRACVIATFMCVLAPLLLLFAWYSSELSADVLLPMLGLMGILVGGPNNIITSAVAADLAEHPSIKGNSRALGTVTGIINGSGSITAALGLLLIGPIQVHYGWTFVWYFLVLCVIFGTMLMSPKVYKEIYDHDEVGVNNSTRAEESELVLYQNKNDRA